MSEELVKQGNHWEKLSSTIGQIPVVLYAAYYAITDKATPTWVRVMIGMALLYLILPLDAIPDVIPGLGLVDDLLVLLGTMGVVGAKIEAEHVFEARHRLKKLPE